LVKITAIGAPGSELRSQTRIRSVAQAIKTLPEDPVIVRQPINANEKVG
jgi:hypothetical protein